MTLLAAPPPAWVTLTLDTTGPVLDFEPLPTRVQPPDVLVLAGTSDEPLDQVSAYFTDEAGALYPLGAEVNGLAVRVLLPSVGLATGRGSLVVLARDRSCNTSRTTLPVYVDRPRPYDLQAATMGVYGTSANAQGAYDLQGQPEHAFDLQARPEAPHDLQSGNARPFDLQSEALDHG